MEIGQILLIFVGAFLTLSGIGVLLSRGDGFLESQMVTLGPVKTKVILVSLCFLIATCAFLAAAGVQIV